MRWKYVVTGVLCLFLGSYLDNIRGPLMPVFSQTFALSYSETSWFLILGNFASVLCLFLLIPLTHYFGEKKVTLGILTISFVGAALTVLVSGLGTLLLLAVVLGSSIAMLGAMSNLWVFRGSDLEHRGRIVCGLQSMYGWASLLAPGVASVLLAAGFSWKWWILAIAPLVVCVAAYVGRRIPDVSETVADKTPALTRLTRVQVAIIVCFSIYVAAEVMVSMWMVAYLVERRSMTVAQAAPYLSGFFFMMGVTRLLCFLSLKPRQETVTLWACLLLSGAFFALGHFVWRSPLAFSLSGCLGPFFPLLLTRISRRFPAQSRSVTLWSLTSVQLTLAVAHLFMGKLIDGVGIEQTYLIPLPLMALTLTMLYLYFWLERRCSDATEVRLATTPSPA